MDTSAATLDDISLDSGQSEPEREQRLKPSKKFERIGMQARLEVLRHSADGLNTREIAKVTGIAHQRISEILQAVEPYKDAARTILERHAKNAASAWASSIPKAAKKGDHRPARDLLIATGVISPTESGTSGVMVVVNMPGELGQLDARSAGSASTVDAIFALPPSE